MTSQDENSRLTKLEDGLYSIDVTGLVCPYPQLLVQGAVEDLSPDDVLEVVLDNPPSVRDVPEALGKREYTSEVTPFDGENWKIVVRKKVE
jgi:tRNA 2-thiouridine synthesizing protein A